MRAAFYAEQQAQGLCTLPKCGEPLAPGSRCHCSAHQVAHREKQRTWIERRRRWWRHANLCIYCNGKRQAIETNPGQFLVYCAVCAEAQSERRNK